MELERFRQTQRRTWEEGDYRPVGRLLLPAARALVGRAGVASGDRVLDVATGSGNVAVTAAAVGAEVTGVDITDAWFDEARQRAGEADVEVDLRVGDVEDLPFGDAAFDAVLSGFGAIFAPRHARVAAELRRVCRPGGTIAMTAWTAEGTNNALFAALSERLPPPPAFAQPPRLWGDPEHVRVLFAAHGVAVRFEHSALPVHFPSVEAFESFALTNSGGFIAARRRLLDLGRWEEARTAMRTAMSAGNEATDGSYRARWEFLIILGTRLG